MSSPSPSHTPADRSAAFWDLEEPIVELARMSSALRIVLFATFELDRVTESEMVSLVVPRVAVDAARQSMISLERLAEGLDGRWQRHAAVDNAAA